MNKQYNHINFQQLFFGFFSFIILLSIGSHPALAQTVNDVAENIVLNSNELPGLITGIAYLTGLVFAARGVIQAKEHVDSPNQTPLRHPLISMVIGGSMFAMPVVYESMIMAISAGDQPDFTPATDAAQATLAGANTNTGNVPNALPAVLANIMASIQTVPGIATAVAYLLGLIAGFSGLLKIKEHVEEPSRTQMREGVTRLLVGGMLLASPIVYEAVYNAVSNDGTLFDATALGQIVKAINGTTTEGGGSCAGFAGADLGNVICNLFISSSPMAFFLTAGAYLFAVFIALWGILKIQEHVLNPQQVSIWDPVAKLFTAAGFFALPNIVSIAYNTLTNGIGEHSNALNGVTRAGDGGGPAGLDGMIGALMSNTFIPMTILINGFGIIAGFVLIFIGISRLMKSAQEGPRGPGGIGTIMTFIAGGALTAFSPMITALSSSLFVGTGDNANNIGTLNYTAGMDADAITRAETVIDAVLLFVMLLGFISIMRGFFIMRGVAEGNSQASSMAGFTHIIGGAIAANLGSLMNAVQVTLGIFDLGLGITFDAGGGGG